MRQTGRLKGTQIRALKNYCILSDSCLRTLRAALYPQYQEPMRSYESCQLFTLPAYRPISQCYHRLDNSTPYFAIQSQSRIYFFLSNYAFVIDVSVPMTTIFGLPSAMNSFSSACILAAASGVPRTELNLNACVSSLNVRTAIESHSIGADMAAREALPP